MIEQTQHFLRQTIQTISQDEIAQLREVIQHHRALYYDDKPVISDSEFDQLYALLVAAEERYNLTHEESPTQEIARLEDNQFTKAPHLHQMMSLDNTYDAEDLRDFEKRIYRILQSSIFNLQSSKLEYIIEYKFDGLGIALLYEGGKFVRALTRGD